MLLSAGERISMALLSRTIREVGGEAISFTGNQSLHIASGRTSLAISRENPATASLT